MSYYGNLKLGETLDVKFTTRQFTTGAPFTLAGSPVVSAYVGNGTTEITAGITLSVDFDGRTGLNNVRVAATAGNGFTAGTNVQLVVTAGTVDGVSVAGEVVGEFSIQNRDVSHFGGYDLYADGAIPLLGIIDKGTAQSATGTTFVRRAAAAFDDNATVGASNIVLGSTQGFWQCRDSIANTLADDTDTVDAWTTTPSGTITYITFAGPPAPVTLPTVNATQLAGQTITAAAGVTFPSSVASPTNITAGTITTVTNLTNAPTSGDLTATMKASVETAVENRVVANHLDHLLAADYDPASKPGVATALLNELVENDGGVARYTANALEQAPTGGSAPTVGEIADEVQTRTIAAVTTVTSVTNNVNAVLANTAHGGTSATLRLGASTGPALHVTATSGNAVTVTSATGRGIGVTGGTDGVLLAGNTGAGLALTGDTGLTATGATNGAYLTGTSGYGLALEGATDDLLLDNSDAPTLRDAVWTGGTRVLSAGTNIQLPANGLDLILVESGISASAALTNDTGTQLTSINARQALALIASALEGVLAGAATTTITIKPAGLPAGNTRVTATVDSNGNRSALTLKVPD